METVGIRDLKTHLSRHLKRVRSGVRLAVTERGRTIATIKPRRVAGGRGLGSSTGRGGARALERRKTHGSRASESVAGQDGRISRA